MQDESRPGNLECLLMLTTRSCCKVQSLGNAQGRGSAKLKREGAAHRARRGLLGRRGAR